MAEVQVIKASEGKVNRRTGKVIQKLRVAAWIGYTNLDRKYSDMIK